MYRCEMCKVVIPPNTPALRVTVETRRKVYPERRNSNRIRIQGKKKPLTTGDPGGIGYETVREVKVCRGCYEKWHDQAPETHAPEVQAAPEPEPESAPEPAPEPTPSPE